jgi:hypothetical protein
VNGLQTTEPLERFLEPGPLLDFEAPEIRAFAEKHLRSGDQIESAVDYAACRKRELSRDQMCCDV